MTFRRRVHGHREIRVQRRIESLDPSQGRLQHLGRRDAAAISATVQPVV